MTRSVAVGFDGSAGAEGAVRWAATEAAATGAELTVVHAVGLLEHAGMAASAAHEGTARRLAGECGLPPERITWQAVDGDPCSALLRAGREAGLVVVGTRGAGAHPGTLLGSTSLELAEHASVPVVIVPAPAGPTR